MALPFSLGLTSLATIIIAPFAWGAGDDAGLSAWMPPASALVFGLPGFFIADRCFKQVRTKTAAAFGLTPGLLVFGVFVMPIAIATEAIVAVSVTDADTYDRLKGGTSGTEISAASFLAVSFGVSLLINSMLAAGAATYTSAIRDESPSRYDRQPGEVDGIGELLSRHDSTS